MPDLSSIRFGFRHGTAVEVLADCVLLFSEEQQLLHRFNETSAVLALRLRGGATMAELEAELSAHGVAAAAASQWVVDFVRQLAGLGLLAADDQPENSQFRHREHFRIGDVDLTVEFDSEEIFQLVGAPLAHLRTTNHAVGITFRVGAAGDFLLIASDGAPPIVTDRAFAAVMFKGMILEHVLGTADHLCALHAACLVGDGGAMLLLGAPGAGKTTLTLALIKQGLRYASDDVTLVLPGGGVRGVPLAPGVKSGAWAMAGDLDAVPIHERPDGQKVRFAPLTIFDGADAHRVAAIISLRRAPGQLAALKPVPPSDGLFELFRESRSPSGACSTEIVQALAAMVGGAQCFDLHYADADDAVPLLLDRVRHG